MSVSICSQWSSSTFCPINITKSLLSLFEPPRNHFLITNSHLTVGGDCNNLLKFSLRLIFSLLLFYKERLSPFVYGSLVSEYPLCNTSCLCFSVGMVQTSHLLRLDSLVETLLWSLCTQPPTSSSSSFTLTFLELASLS